MVGFNSGGDEPTRFDDGSSPTHGNNSFGGGFGDGNEATYIADAGAELELQSGQVLGGQFEVVRLLGRGGMGAVYEANDRLTGQKTALKIILPSVLAKPRAIQRFMQEVNTARQLRHPGIVAVYDVRQVGSLFFYTMEFLEGQSLRQMLSERGCLSLDEVAQILAQLCDALAYAHQFTVHRDLSPENVMLLPNGTVKLLDFGIAKALDPKAITTTTRSVIGKPYYMAPEQRKDSANIDKRADIFALGVMFFETLTGDIPMGVGKVTDARPDLPPECDDLFSRAVAHNPDQRFPDVVTFGDALNRCRAVARLHDAKSQAEAARAVISATQQRRFSSVFLQAEAAMQRGLQAKGDAQLACESFEAAKSLYEKVAACAADYTRTLREQMNAARAAAEQARERATNALGPYSPSVLASDVLRRAATVFENAERCETAPDREIPYRENGTSDVTELEEALRLYKEAGQTYEDALTIARERWALAEEAERERVRAIRARDTLTGDARRYAPDMIAEVERLWALAADTGAEQRTRRDLFTRITELCASAADQAAVRKREAERRVAELLAKTQAARAALSEEVIKGAVDTVRQADESLLRAGSAGDDLPRAIELLEEAARKYEHAQSLSGSIYLTGEIARWEQQEAERERREKKKKTIITVPQKKSGVSKAPALAVLAAGLLVMAAIALNRGGSGSDELGNSPNVTESVPLEPAADTASEDSGSPIPIGASSPSSTDRESTAASAHVPGLAATPLPETRTPAEYEGEENAYVDEYTLPFVESTADSGSQTNPGGVYRPQRAVEVYIQDGDELYYHRKGSMCLNRTARGVLDHVARDDNYAPCPNCRP